MTKQNRNQASAASSPELEKERDAILELLGKGEDVHWQIGVHYNNIVDGRLAEKTGYKHARDFFAKELSAMPQSTLSLYGAMAKTFSEPATAKYGVTALRALIRYERLTDEELSKDDPGDLSVALPQLGGGGETVEKRFGDCTLAELEAAIRFAENPTDVPVPPEFTKRLDAVRKALQEVPNHNPFIVVSGRPVPGAFGGPEMRVTIKLPIGHLETLRDALDLAFPKTDEQAKAEQRPAPRSKAPKRTIKRASSRGHASRGGLSHPRGSQSRGRVTAPRR